jgi:hypothetical protein
MIVDSVVGTFVDKSWYQRWVNAAQHSVHLTGGYAPRYLDICLALSFSRFDRESTLPPQAANASRWAAESRFLDYNILCNDLNFFIKLLLRLDKHH